MQRTVLPASNLEVQELVLGDEGRAARNRQMRHLRNGPDGGRCGNCGAKVRIPASGITTCRECGEEVES